MRITIIALSLSLVTSTCTADTIVLKDGRQLQGKVVARSRNKIAIKTDAGKLVMVKSDEVAEIVKGDKKAPPRTAPKREDKGGVAPRQDERETALPSAEQPEPLPNASFEVDRNRDGVPDGWRFAVKAKRIRSDAADGKYFVRLFAEGQKMSAAICESGIAVRPNSLYRITVQARQSNASCNLNCVPSLDGSGSRANSWPVWPSAWTRQDVFFTTGPDARRLKRLSLSHNRRRRPGEGWWDVDAVTLTRVGPAPQGRVGLADEFDDAEGWTGYRGANVRSENGKLIVQGPPGSGVLKYYGVLDLAKYRYMVTKLDERYGMGMFDLQWNRASPEAKFGNHAMHTLFGSVSGISALDLSKVVVNVRGPQPVRINLWGYGRGVFDWLRFVNELTPEERKGLVRVPPRLERRGGVRRHGLTELAKRRGIKPEAPADPRGWYPAETTVYSDTVTRTAVWRVTDSPGTDKRGPEAWSRDGRWLLLASDRRRPDGRGAGGYWLIDTQSKQWYAPPPGKWLWAPANPPTLYASWPTAEGLCVNSFDPESLSSKRVACVDTGGRRGGDVLAMSPNRSEVVLSSRSAPALYLLDLQTGAAREIPVKERGTRILGFRDVAIMRDGTIRAAPLFDTDAGRHGKTTEAWALDREGSFLRSGSHSFGGHPCVNEDGSRVFYYAHFWIKSNDARNAALAGERLLAWHGATSGHLSWGAGGWVMASIGTRGPWEHLIVRVSTDGRGFLHTVCDPDSYHVRGAYESHPRVNASPDGTKALYNSDMMGNSDCYVAVVRTPDPPRKLAAGPADGRVSLTWQEPVNCRELLGYYVYRSQTSGTRARALNADVLTEPRFADRDVENGTTYYYTVTAVEHFGLESLPSNEVCATAPSSTSWRGPVRHFVEAEQGDIQPPLRPWIDGAASGNVCVNMFRYYKDDPKGTMELAVPAPKEGRCYLWGRVRGQPGQAVEVMASGRSAGRLRIPAAEQGRWVWTPLTATGTQRARIDVETTPCRLRLAANDDGIALDQLLLTDDGRFTPKGLGGQDNSPPARAEGLTVASTDRSTVRLRWDASQDLDLARYDVFSSEGSEVELSNQCLVGSTRETSFVDWGLRPGAKYSYVVTAADRRGNRSKPSATVSASTAAIELARIDLEMESAFFESPLVKRDDPTASGGACLALPAVTPRDRLTPESLKLNFELPKASRYDVWLRAAGIRADTSRLLSDDKFRSTGTFRLDRRYFLWWQCRSFVRPEVAEKGRIEWQWVKLTYRDTIKGRTPFDMAAGAHSLTPGKFVVPDGELRLDKIIITDDAGFVPEG